LCNVQCYNWLYFILFSYLVVYLFLFLFIYYLFLSVGILNMHNAKIGYSVKSEYKNNIDIMSKLKNIETDIPVF